MVFEVDGKKEDVCTDDLWWPDRVGARRKNAFQGMSSKFRTYFDAVMAHAADPDTCDALIFFTNEQPMAPWNPHSQESTRSSVFGEFIMPTVTKTGGLVLPTPTKTGALILPSFNRASAFGDLAMPTVSKTAGLVLPTPTTTGALILPSSTPSLVLPSPCKSSTIRAPPRTPSPSPHPNLKTNLFPTDRDWQDLLRKAQPATTTEQEAVVEEFPPAVIAEDLRNPPSSSPYDPASPPFSAAHLAYDPASPSFGGHALAYELASPSPVFSPAGTSTTSSEQSLASNKRKRGEEDDEAESVYFTADEGGEEEDEDIFFDAVQARSILKPVSFERVGGGKRVKIQEEPIGGWGVLNWEGRVL
jgi:hypothetical protein